MMAFPFDAVLFDCDGVLVDSEPITSRVLADMLGELGWSISQEETMRYFTGRSVRDEAPLIETRTGATVDDAWLLAFRERRNQALESDLLVVPGAPVAVQQLQTLTAGRIAVASGADRQKVEMQLRKVGLIDYFAGQIFSGYETPRTKPYPDVYLAAAQALQIDPQRCAIVEDSVAGVTAGVAAGATVFAYHPDGINHCSAEALLAAGAVQIFKDMHALPELLTHWHA